MVPPEASQTDVSGGNEFNCVCSFKYDHEPARLPSFHKIEKASNPFHLSMQRTPTSPKYQSTFFPCDFSRSRYLQHVCTFEAHGATTALVEEREGMGVGRVFKEVIVAGRNDWLA